MKNIQLLLMPIFKKDKYSIHTVLNWGTVDNDKITYPNKDGLITESLNSFDDSIIVRKFEELDLEDSLRGWFKNNGEHYNKDIVIDYELSEGEIYRGLNSYVPHRLPLMVKATDKCILVKPIYN